MARYPGAQYRGGGDAAGSSGLSNEAGDSPPALGFLAPSPPPFAAPPPPTLAPAVGAGGAGGGAIRLTIGAARGLPSPAGLAGAIAAGALLGYVGYEVASWDWTPKVQWMPPGFIKTGWISPGCSTYDNGRSQPWDNWVEWSSGFDLLGPGADCAPPQVDAGHPWGTGFVDPATTKIAITRNHNTLPGRCVLWEQWNRPFPGVGVPAPADTPWPDGVPDGLPWLDPAVVPINVPVPATKPPPFRYATPKPGQMPAKPKPAKWPDVVTLPAVTAPVVLAPPHVGGRPTVGRGTTVDSGNLPGSGTDPGNKPEPSSPPAHSPPPGARSAPPEGAKEKKVQIRTAYGPLFYAALNLSTEGLDLVRELYKAVPKKCRKAAGIRSSRPSVAEKMKAIYHCSDQMNVGEAIANVINNEFEDWFYGQQGRLLKGASQNLGVTTGLNRALRMASQEANPDGQTILPELTYEKGVWGLQWMGYSVQDPYGQGEADRLTDLGIDGTILSAGG